MRHSTFHLCSSIICCESIALGSSLKRGKVNLVMHTHRSSFVCHNAKFFSVLIHHSDHIRKALDDEVKFVDTGLMVDQIVDEAAGHTDLMSVERFQFDFKSRINQIFSDYNSCNKLLFDKFIMQDLRDCNTANVARFMCLAGKKSRRDSIVLLKKHLPSIAKRLQALSS